MLLRIVKTNILSWQLVNLLQSHGQLCARELHWKYANLSHIFCDEHTQYRIKIRLLVSIGAAFARIAVHSHLGANNQISGIGEKGAPDRLEVHLPHFKRWWIPDERDCRQIHTVSTVHTVCDSLHNGASRTHDRVVKSATRCEIHRPHEFRLLEHSRSVISNSPSPLSISGELSAAKKQIFDIVRWHLDAKQTNRVSAIP